MPSSVFKFRHPDGADMRFSESLSSYLASRDDKAAPFFLGHWLDATTDDELDGLMQLTARFRDGDQSCTTDDLLALVVIARSAERRSPRHVLDPEVMIKWLGVLYVAVNVEIYRRKGWLVLARPLSIQPHRQISLSLTEQGLEHAQEFSHGVFDA